MHYALHIAIPCILLWSVRDGENAAKTAVNPEVLTALAKNVASVLSPTLLSEYHVLRSNRTSATPPTGQGELQSKFNVKSNVREPLETPYTDSLNRYGRNPREDRSPISRPAERLQAIYITSAISPEQQRDAKEKGPGSSSRVATSQNTNTPRNNEETGNTNDQVNTDVSTADIHHFQRFRFPEFHKHKHLPFYGGSVGHYGPFGFPPHYNHYPSFGHSYQDPTPSTEQTSEVEGEGVDNNPPTTEELRSSARTAYRPYDRPYDDPYYSSFYGHPRTFYPGGRTKGATDQPNNPEGQTDDNGSAAPEDRERASFRPYGYDPYYNDPFYGRPYHYTPYGSRYSSEGNSTAEEPRFRDYSFDAHYPYRPSFYGHPQDADPSRNPADQGSTADDGESAGNSTTPSDQPPYGRHPFRPLHGGFHLQGYPSSSYNLLPYDHFNTVFNVPTKGLPFPGFYPDPLPYFPTHPYSHPFLDGFHPYGHHRPVAPKTPAKPETADETAAGSPESPSEGSANADAEVISESKLEKLIRASRLPQNENKIYRSPSAENYGGKRRTEAKRFVLA